MNRRQIANYFGLQTRIPGAATKNETVLERQALAGGKEWRRAVIEETVAFTGTDAFKALTQALPAGATVIQADMNLDVAFTLATAVKLGVGTSGDPDAFALSAATMTKNTKTVNRPAVTTGFLAASTTPRVSTVDTNGAAAGSASAGTARVRILYEYIQALPDA